MVYNTQMTDVQFVSIVKYA